jgi:orotate phosphoribosyltransferase
MASQSLSKLLYANSRGLLADMASDNKERLAKMLRQKSFSFGNFRLSSGQESKYYFDCKLTTLDPEGAFLTGAAVMEAIDELALAPEAIGGMTMGADPIVSATIVASHMLGAPLPGFLIRKEHKEHGKQKRIEGFDVSNKRVLIIDEVCTTGKSIFEAIEAVQNENGEILGVVSFVDREEGGSEEIRKRGYRYKSIFTARQLVEESLKPAHTA